MNAQTTNERLAHDDVKPVMDRMRFTFVALLPAVWLLALSQPAFAYWNSGAASGCGCEDSCSSVASGKPCSSHDTESPAIAGRKASPRFLKHASKNRLPFPHVTAEVHCLAPEAPAILSFLAQRQCSLAARWQFEFRAASNPRAPSLVS